MTEEEALIRAREALIENGRFAASASEIRAGERDSYITVQVAKRALLNADKPLPVDRDLADLRDLFAAHADNHSAPSAANEYRRGFQDEALRKDIPTFRAIIQRRIEESRS